jgi:hypothetical protein
MPREGGRFSIAVVQPAKEDEPEQVRRARPLTIDFTRNPREPFSSPIDGQEAEIMPLFDSADELAARAPATCSSEYLLYADKPVRIPGLSKATFWVPAPLSLREYKDCALFVDRLPNREGVDDSPIVIPAVEVTNEAFKIRVTVVNISEKALTLPQMLPLASLHVRFKLHEGGGEAIGTDTSKPSERLTKEQLEMLDSANVDPNDELTPDQREQVRQLLSRRIQAFALNPKSPNHTHLVEVELPLNPGAQPHRHAPSRLGVEGEKLVDKEVSTMEKNGIIRKSNSAWASRIVLVTKKDGTVRFCNDYRDLNAKLQREDSPLPLTAEAIDRLSSGQGSRDSLFLCVLDLASGFWGLPVKESDKHLTAFCTHRGKYEYNYLPFGLQSGPSYMCRVMDAVLEGLAWDICMPYLDDIGIFSTGNGDTLEERCEASFQQMLHRLDLVLERLIWAGLTCKMSKCTFFSVRAEYLGHIVSRDGLAMAASKIEAVSNIDAKSINTLEKVRQFLGLCSYYRKFIRRFAIIACPLTRLTRSGCDVAEESQTEECQTAIEALKKAITSEPVLIPPREDRIFSVKTDGASTQGIGAVLAQRDDDGRERVVAYYGRALQPAEKNWTVTEIELLAALEAIRNWRPYVWGRRFKLVIDHAALRWLHTMKDQVSGGPASRLTRWALKLSEYNFEVEHKPGANHCDADAISRLVAAIVNSPHTVNQQSDMGTLDIATIRQATVTARRLQAKDRAVRRMADSRTSVVDSYLDVGVPSGEVFRRELDAEPFARDMMDHLLVHLPSEDSDLATQIQSEALRFVMKDGLLYYRSVLDSHDPIHRRLYVPETLRHSYLVAFHDTAGHMGVDRMCRLLRARVYWPHLAQDVAEYVRGCHECTMAKAPMQTLTQPTGPTVGTYPFDVVYCDILSMAPTHDFVKGQTGFDKLVVFVDSLTRWIEAQPVNGDPSSEQILSTFMEMVVSRHGMPRTLRTDLGSNLTSKLCQIVLSKTGTDLSSTEAYRHEGVGLVERAQQTLTAMVRASNEGGSHWVDHLPFLLMAMRATGGRVTKQSPAALLYGRELRLPSQLIDPRVPASVEFTESMSDVPKAYRQYVEQLNAHLRLAWLTALEATQDAQEESALGIARKTNTDVTFKVGDRVCRRIPGHSNKLQFLYSGPYRVLEVLSNSRYKLRDLENRLVHDEVHISNLRPYHTVTDADPLEDDEYLVEELLDRRGSGSRRQFLVKWRGYPRNEATWEPETELLRRCAELVTDFKPSNKRKKNPSREATVT